MQKHEGTHVVDGGKGGSSHKGKELHINREFCRKLMRKIMQWRMEEIQPCKENEGDKSPVQRNKGDRVLHNEGRRQGPVQCMKEI